MEQTTVDVLDPQSLPSDPREMALRLLGMTAAELKGIDEKVVSGRNSVGGIRTDINRIVHDFNTNLKPGVTTPPPTNVQVLERVSAQPHSQPQPVIAAQPIITQQEDTPQLEFDFYKKIKPEDLEYQIRLVNQSLTNINDKLNVIHDLLKKSCQEINGSHSQ